MTYPLRTDDVPAVPSRHEEGRSLEEEILKDTVLIDLKTTTLTLGEVMSRIEGYKQDPLYRNCEIFMDGDRYAIVARPRRKR